MESQTSDSESSLNPTEGSTTDSQKDTNPKFKVIISKPKPKKSELDITSPVRDRSKEADTPSLNPVMDDTRSQSNGSLASGESVPTVSDAELGHQLFNGNTQRVKVRSEKTGTSFVRITTVSPRTEAGTITNAEIKNIDPARESWVTRLQRAILGTPINNEEAQHERVGKFRALAILSSDALSSVAYGTEASLAVLITAGATAMGMNIFIGLAIITLLGIVAFSYRQTIRRYPAGGGSYIVAKDNLGQKPALIAAAALLIDYVLTVSVSVSAGVDALTSAFRPLEPYSVGIGLVLIAIIMIVNLRGVRESGTVFSAPTYLFVGSFLLMIVVGIIKAITNGGLLTPTHLAGAFNSPSQIPHLPLEQLSLLLILTAFASGCSAMTGTEAISDAVPIFKGAVPQKQAQNASQTLVLMASLLAIMYGGTTYLAWRFGFQPQVNSHPTVISEMAQYFFPGFWQWFFYLFQFATTLILVLAANTSFNDFPRLSFFLARDEFLPHLFQIQGDRLAYNTGIIVLGVLSSLLLVIFSGNTNALINLYALGVFLAFTMSQSSMVVRWVQRREPGWKHGLPISAFGAFATAVVTAIITVTKFDRGAWVVCILIPLLFFMFLGIKHHYTMVKRHLDEKQVEPLAVAANHIVVVPISQLNTVAFRGLSYAHMLSNNVIALHVIATSNEREEGELRAHWKAFIESDQWVRQPTFNLVSGDEEPLPEPIADDNVIGTIKGPKLVVIQATNRAIVSWIIRFIDTLQKRHPEARITVVLPEYVPTYAWEWFLHNLVAIRLKLWLLRRPEIVTSNVPYQVMERPKPTTQTG